MLPAKEVGGDFYDLFMICEDKLAMVIADVSGKGVPAALFMVIAKTLIKNNAQSGKSPKDVFETVNNILCENNDAGMFVTAFMGILDIPTGRFTFVNAGHNPPLVKRAGGEYSFLKIKPAFVLAGLEGMAYSEEKMSLSAGDVIYLYTDGVTEAMNAKNELFSDQRLLETMNRYKDCSLKELLLSVKNEIDIFADGAEQADDITMLALEITGGADE
jgi:sigma-B regulation protein RsbU (phosphoserine phosphatase)